MNMSMVCKRCKCCGEMLSITRFGKHYKTRDGYQTICKDCCREKSIVASKTTPVITMVKEQKLCKCCNTSKPLELFYKNKATSDGLMYICKRCFEIKYRKNVTLQSKPKPIIIKEKLPPSIGGHEVTSLDCLGCKKSLPISEFEDSVSGNFGKALYCKKCSIQVTTPTVKATGFTVKDGFAIKNEVKQEPSMLEDATLAHLVGTFIRTGITLFKYITKEVK